MANITQLAKTFNLTRQGIYKIDKANKFNLSSLDDVKAEELLKAYLDNKKKNKNYIAKKLNISITKLNNLTDRFNIIYADYETAEEIIEEIKQRLSTIKAQEEKEVKQKQYSKTYFKIYMYLLRAIGNNNKVYLRLTKAIENPKHRHSREFNIKCLETVNEQYIKLVNDINIIKAQLKEIRNGNIEVVEKELRERAAANGVTIKDG